MDSRGNRQSATASTVSSRCESAHRHRKLESLALVSHVCGELDVPVALPGTASAVEPRMRVGDQAFDQGLERVKALGPARRRTRERTRSCDQIGMQDAVGGQRAGILAGTRCVLTPISSATATAWSPAAPPKAIMANSRGSKPFSNNDKRIAAPRLELVTASNPSAAASTERSSGFADLGRIAARAASLSSRIPPPRKLSPLSLPSTRFASVTVGSRPAAAIARGARA